VRRRVKGRDRVRSVTPRAGPGVGGVPVTAQLADGALLVVPLFLGLATHGCCIRLGLLRGAAVSIARRTFGENKTYRGVVCVALGTALGFVVVAPKGLGLGGNPRVGALALVGFLVGAAAMMAELPNSWLKRRAGIAPGAQAGGPLGVAFHLLDQVDVVFGAWVVLAWVAEPTVPRLMGSLATVYVGHQLLSLVGYWLGMRTTPR
jgi:CDP-archaeol synthase